MQNVGRMNVLQATEDLYQVTVFVQSSLAYGVGKGLYNGNAATKKSKNLSKLYEIKTM